MKSREEKRAGHMRWLDHQRLSFREHEVIIKIKCTVAVLPEQKRTKTKKEG